MDFINLPQFLTWARDVGLTAVILIIWYFDSKKIAMLIGMVDKVAGISKDLVRVVEEGHERERSVVECLQMNIACLSRLEQKINDNVFCPIVRKETGK